MGAEKEYTVEELMGCRIITGPVPITDLIPLMAGPEDEVWLTDLNLGPKLGATMVLGTRANLDRLALSEGIIERVTQRAVGIKQQIESEGGVVPQSALEWLVDGERGRSSDAVFAFLTHAKTMASTAHPRDAHDFRRCRLLLDRVPEFRGAFPLVKYLSPTWARITINWAKLCGAMEAESPTWPNGIEHSSRFNSVLRTILEDAQ